MDASSEPCSGPPTSTPQRPFQDSHDVIRPGETYEHGDANGDGALDDDPPQILEVIEKRFYRPALFFFRLFVKAVRYGFVSHARNRLANQTFVTGRTLRDSFLSLGLSGAESGGIGAGRRCCGGGVEFAAF